MSEARAIRGPVRSRSIMPVRTRITRTTARIAPLGGRTPQDTSPEALLNDLGRFLPHCAASACRSQKSSSSLGARRSLASRSDPLQSVSSVIPPACLVGTSADAREAIRSIRIPVWFCLGLRRKGVALIAVLYFLVVCALTTTAVLFAERTASRNEQSNSAGTQLISLAEDGLYSALANWNAAARLRQTIGTTARIPASRADQTPIYVTRLTTRLFIITADVRAARDGATRRVNLLVRVPLPALSLPAALITNGDVTLSADARVIADSLSCGDTPRAALAMTPAATLSIDPAMPLAEQPTVARDPSAGDSTIYSTLGGSTWNDLVLAADVRIAAGAHIAPAPLANGGACTRGDANWGDPSSLTSACAGYVPVVFAEGDLTIDGGRGQGVLLVDGHLVIAGPFEFSGQIVAKRGIETIADNIAISGVVYAWRSGNDSLNTRAAAPAVVLTHRTSIRYSGCDASHGIASWLQPQRVSNYAWSELF